MNYCWRNMSRLMRTYLPNKLGRISHIPSCIRCQAHSFSNCTAWYSSSPSTTITRTTKYAFPSTLIPKPMTAITLKRSRGNFANIYGPTCFTRFASTSSSTSSSSSLSVEMGIDDLQQVDAMPLNVLDLMEIHATTTTGTIFSNTGPVIWTADFLTMLKDFNGLSWVQVIVTTTIVIRLLTGLPTVIAQQRSLKRLEEIKPKVVQLAEDLKKETGFAIRKFGWDEKTAKRQFRKSYKKHWRKLMEEHNCHPMKIPVWICFSSALRNIVFGLPLPRSEEQAQRWYEMYQEGTPWIENLTVSDPVVLPAVFLIANLVNIYLHSRSKALPTNAVRSNFQKALPWIFSGGVTFIAVFACYVPSAVTLYWATSSSVALTQNIILLHPGLRRSLKMPIPSSSISQTPSVPVKS